jgi:hypothetical protein
MTFEQEIARGRGWHNTQLSYGRRDLYLLHSDGYGNVFGKQGDLPPPNRFPGSWHRLLGPSKGLIDWGYLWLACSEITQIEENSGSRNIKLVTNRFEFEKTLYRNHLLYVAVGEWGDIGTFSTSGRHFGSQAW